MIGYQRLNHTVNLTKSLVQRSLMGFSHCHFCFVKSEAQNLLQIAALFAIVKRSEEGVGQISTKQFLKTVKRFQGWNFRLGSWTSGLAGVKGRASLFLMAVPDTAPWDRIDLWQGLPEEHNQHVCVGMRICSSLPFLFSDVCRYDFAWGNVRVKILWVFSQAAELVSEKLKCGTFITREQADIGVVLWLTGPVAFSEVKALMLVLNKLSVQNRFSD